MTRKFFKFLKWNWKALGKTIPVFIAIVLYAFGKQHGATTSIAETTELGYGKLSDNGFWQYTLPEEFRDEFERGFLWRDIKNFFNLKDLWSSLRSMTFHISYEWWQWFGCRHSHRPYKQTVEYSITLFHINFCMFYDYKYGQIVEDEQNDNFINSCRREAEEGFEEGEGNEL